MQLWVDLVALVQRVTEPILSVIQQVHQAHVLNLVKVPLLALHGDG